MLPSPILPGTDDHVARWIDTAKQQRLTIEENALMDAGAAEGRKVFLIVLFTRSFLALGCSFHATVRDYCSRIIAKDLGFHETRAVAMFLSIVLPYVTELLEHDIIDIDLAALLGDESVGTYIQWFEK